MIDLNPLKWLLYPALWMIPAIFLGAIVAGVVALFGGPFGLTFFAIMVASFVCGMVHAAVSS